MKLPIYLDSDERVIWREIVRASPVPLTDADRPALEILVSLVHKQRGRVELSANERSTLLKLIIEFRGTPGSRSKAMPPRAEGDNEFAKLD